MHKKWFKRNYSKLTKAGKDAKALVMRICKVLTKYSGRNFYVTMNAFNNDYEGHIIDSGKCVEVESDIPFAYELKLSDCKNAKPIGMIFYGGFFNMKKFEDAESLAWVSLVEDCIGQCDDVELREIHNLTNSLKDFGPQLDFNCKNFEELKEKLNELERE